MKKTFTEWALQGRITVNSAYSYRSYFKNAEDNDFFNFSNIELFWNAGDNYYALAICDKILSVIEEQLKTARTKDLSNAQSAYRLLKLFLEIGPRVQSPDFESEQKLKLIRKKINKPDLPKIDGNIPILSALKIEDFIKLAVEHSYFFSPHLVDQRNIDMRGFISGNINGMDNDKEIPEIPCRTSTKDGLQITNDDKQSFFIDNKGFKVRIRIDKSNNTQVCQLIRQKTGFTVSEGKDCIFRNYIISHIWGQAYDPRYFTSFWNIVLIPSWANFLMDVENPPKKTLESRMQSTYKTLCKRLYKKVDFKNLMLSADSSIIENKQYSDRLKDSFRINIIQEKQKGEKIARIIIEEKTTK